ncbi:helix-turn-helix domain-containing protein [Streptomyces sp. NBC_01264]|uniref:helix-turn-helix domain-containing protein n=1 Tax=Streptomyces sp. NBC_01264 TaxID=2903804 RepID=UPI002252DA5A|nr:helix-turn-helix transcriptional regulator [Streptomyces sp. NBC_01264]MCX4783333.1 helix-turn-helix transcriptional regulator [Streptomyces sp. NBC_01264]
MSASPSSSAQTARLAVAARLREIMLDAGLQGQELAALCGWNGAKTSRIINAKTAPSDKDIRAWCTACGADGQAEDLIAASRAVDSMYVEWRRLTRTGLRRLQESAVPLYERTRHFRAYSSRVVPGVLQTEAYATALLATVADFRRTPDDVADAVTARLARSRIIRTGNHRFAILVEEGVLYYRLGSAETMAEQLRHLLSAMSLPAVSLGVIPFTAERSMWPTETFNVFDDVQANVELLSAQVTVTSPSELALYVQAFDRFKDLAVHGARARALISRAIDSLS